MSGRRRIVAVAVAIVVLLVAGMVVLTTVASAAGTGALDTTVSYQLVSRSSGKALAIAGKSTADKASVVQTTRSGGTDQQFRFVATSGGYYRVTSVLSGKVLGGTASSAEAAPVTQSADTGATDQQWQLKNTGGSVQVINRASGKALDVKSWSRADGATVQQYRSTGHANQQWSLLVVPAAPVTVTPTPPVTPTPAPPATTSPTTAPVTTLPTTLPATTAPPTSPTAPPAGGGSGTTLWVNPDNAAARQVAAWQASGRAADARTLNRVATQPVASWVTGGSASQVAASVDRTADKAQAGGAEAVFVAYDIPGRDCGSYSAGGANGDAAYAQWVAGFAAGLGGRKAIVILEPDAIPQQIGGCTPGTTRYADLAGAVEALEAAGADVYLDAGHPGWVSDIRTLAAALTSAGVGDAAGFSINVSNFVPTDRDIAYGKQISAALGGKHFVIDTSRNGVTPPPVTSRPSWCNPPGAKIGPTPTLNTGDPLVDAYLWVKPPGESDGACRPGEPAAGGWMPEYALALAS